MDAGIPMVCFTDIPICLSDKHRKEYGNYGIGMKKEWGIKNGLNPICYIIKDSELYNSFNHLQFIIAQQAQEIDKIYYKDPQKSLHTFEIVNAVMDFAGYMKVYSEDEKKLFYDEREWRYLPPFKEKTEGPDGRCNRLIGDYCNENEKKKLNDFMEKKYPLEFTEYDIAEIILENNSEVSMLIEELNKLEKNIDIENLKRKIKICNLD